MAVSGVLVLRPDVLLSGTRVAGSFKCARQALLEERFGGTSGRKAMEGTLLHSLFEARPVVPRMRTGMTAASQGHRNCARYTICRLPC